MKKLSGLAVIIAMMILPSCQKSSDNLASGNGNNVLVTPPANVTSTIIVSVIADPADVEDEPFNGNFTISVPDQNNIFEKQAVRLVSRSKDVVHYAWKINDLKITEKNPTLNFAWHGIYHVTLIVTDKDGNTATSARDLTILCNFMH